MQPAMNLPSLNTPIPNVDLAWRIALGDIATNIIPYHSAMVLERHENETAPQALPDQQALLKSNSPILLAGFDYPGLWTRDSAINISNGASLLMPNLGKNTLISVLEQVQGRTFIAGQYWDLIIWTMGAWEEYLFSSDREFLRLAFDATCNSLKQMELNEFDSKLNLFRGPAVYGDGVAAYPDIYTRTRNGSSSILQWPAVNPNSVSKNGFGLPMHSLSTNCVYYLAYVYVGRMAEELGVAPDRNWLQKSESLKEAINCHFWMPEIGLYRYLVDPLGNCDYQEGLGHAFAILFGIASPEQVQTILSKLHFTQAGFPCLWPSFPRYNSIDGKSFGRHSGVVWPHVQGFLVHAAAKAGRAEIVSSEIQKLAEFAVRDRQFLEIYHPLSGIPYGGIQERGPERRYLWKSCTRQTWSATAYLRMILMGIFGMRFETDGIRFEPLLPEGWQKARLTGLRYRDMELTIEITGRGNEVSSFIVNDSFENDRLLSCEAEGIQRIEIRLKE